MNGDYGYAAECLSKAVAVLVTGAGPIRERLYAAHIQLAPADDDDFLEVDHRERHRRIRDQLNKALPASTTQKRVKMTDKEAVRIALEIWNLHCAMQVFLEEARRERERERER